MIDKTPDPRMIDVGSGLVVYAQYEPQRFERVIFKFDDGLFRSYELGWVCKHCGWHIIWDHRVLGPPAHICGTGVQDAERKAGL